MNNNNFMIGPIKDGLRKDVKPYAIPEDSFDSITNAYQWRGRVIRRQGYTLLGRLANNTSVMGLKTRQLYGASDDVSVDLRQLIAFDTTNAYFYDSISTSFLALPTEMPTVWSGEDYQFFYTLNYAGAFWATNSKQGLHGFAINKTTSFANQTTSGGNFFVDVNDPANNFQVNDVVYILNSLINNLRQGVVTVSGATFTMKATDGLGVFTNGNTSSGIVLSSTRSKTGQDGIRYYGVLSNGTGWANYNPPIDPNNALCGALLIFSYRGYLVFLNTYEGNETAVYNYGNRARWTQIGTPYYTAPQPLNPNPQGIDFNTARDDLFGRGGANDAPTTELIVGAAFIRDILIVYFETSTWRLRFVNNSQNPFVWERVNVELGSDCTFSAIPFDKGLMSIGTRGIVISDGNDTVRFDEKIPDDIFNIRQANNGLNRVYGIRTFRTRLNYWTIPSSNNPTGTYPDQVLVYNYDTSNWSYFDDCFTCFGYYYNVSLGYKWSDLPLAWTNYGGYYANTGATSQGYESIIAGNQQGFVLLLEQNSAQNGNSLYISAINTTTQLVSSPSNNLPDGTWITISGVTGTTSIDGVSLNGRNFKIANPTNDDTTFYLTEFASFYGGKANGATYTNSVDYTPILAGSIQINIGALVFTDPNLDGILTAGGANVGTINYTSGNISLTFSPVVVSTDVYIRYVSVDPEQELEQVSFATAYTGSGLIAKISNINIQSKIFNFFGDDKRSRLSKIDFYVKNTSEGQFTCNVFGDSSDVPINVPLKDNAQSNVVLTTANPYQIAGADGDQTIYRLYCDALAQTVQVQLTLSDRQMAVNPINSSTIEITSMMFSLRRGGRLT